MSTSLPQKRPARQPKLFTTPQDGKPPVVRPMPLTTRGRVEYTVRCPGCDGFHRHVHVGRAAGPCGAVYVIRSRSVEKRAAMGGAA